jgi:hypothetical protein
LLSFRTVTAHGPKVPESPEATDTTDIDEAWGEPAPASTKPPPASTKPAPATTKPAPATTKPAVTRAPLRGPLASSPEIILHDDLSPEIEIDPDPIEYDADMLLSDSRPTLPVPNPLKYDIVPESERNTTIPPEPRVPKIPGTRK